MDNSKNAKNKAASLDPSNWKFDEETIHALSDLGDIFRRIHNRMKAEGYGIVEGKVIKLEALKA